MATLVTPAQIDAAAQIAAEAERAAAARLGEPFPYLIIEPPWDRIDPPANPEAITEPILDP